MSIIEGKKVTLRAAILALAVAVAAPTVALADPPQGRGRGNNKNKISQQERKNEKFRNGHDARDGRWDGRGPGSRDDRYDDEDYDGYGRRRDRNTGTYDRTEIRDRALRAGYNEGYRAGRDDRASGRSFDYSDHSAYRDATSGYNSSYGDVDYYRSIFRQGFRQGYEDGYRNRSTRSGRWGDILGDILGRP